jgi:hypothetical protein
MVIHNHGWGRGLSFEMVSTEKDQQATANPRGSFGCGHADASVRYSANFERW